jgi:two-component system, OmpR family, alkaline phosphatase synthesis response regulator PhoP
MESLNTEIKNKILEFLKTTKYGASSSEISKSIGHNRVTVTKYLEIMRAHKLISYDEVAQAKLWHICAKSDKPVVLVVDDEPYVVNLVALSLIPGKYEVIKSYSGLDALERVKKDAPDLIILDLMMPGLDGYEVCKKLKENALTQHIPIIILSAKGEMGDKLKGIKMGADDYMTKPFDPMELEARASLVLRRTNHHQDVHPLTKLSGRNAIKDNLQRRMLKGEEFVVYSFSAENLAECNRQFGCKKGNDVLVLISRMLSDMIMASEETFLGHTQKDHFIVISQRKDIDEKACAAFERMVPYIYNGTVPKSAISLKASKLSSKDIRKKGTLINEIMVQMNIW